MNATSAFQPRLTGLIATFGICVAFLLAHWPGPQSVVHSFIVLGLAPGTRSYFNCAIIAAAAGWASELGLRAYPGLGGTAMGNMVCALILWYSLFISPPERAFTYYLQLLLATMLHVFVVHFFVGIAAGQHVWGYGWQWSLALLPIWGPLAWRLHSPQHMR